MDNTDIDLRRLAAKTICLIEEEIPRDLKGYELLQEVGNILNVERETWEMLKVFVTKIAEPKKIEVQVLVNEWLRNNIKLIQNISLYPQ